MRKIASILKLALLACGLQLSFCGALSAGAPLKINFQGRLDESGQPAEGSKTFVFKIYDAVSGGSLVWTSASQSLALSQGVFSASLAAGTPAPLSTATFAGARFVEITVDGVTLSPRQEMVSAPYAMVAQSLAPDAEIPAASIGAGSVNDSHVVLTTAAITSGKFSDSRVLITTGAFAALNGADQLVKLDGTGRLPAVDGSQLSGVSGAQFSAVGTATGTLRADLSAVIASTAPLSRAANWDAAYGWGDHSAAGYVTSAAQAAALSGYAALTSTQSLSGSNYFTSVSATVPGVTISSGLVVAAGRVGVGTNLPASTLSVGGSLSLGIRTLAEGTHDLGEGDHTLLADASVAAVVINLPDPASAAGRVYVIKAVNVDNGVTINAVGSTIDNNPGPFSLTAVREYCVLQSGGAGWHMIGGDMTLPM